MQWRRPSLMVTDQRDRIAKCLNRKATRPVSFKQMGGIFSKVTEQLRVTPKYGLFKGTETYAWKLETTGASQTDTETVELKDDGRIESIHLDFPAGSKYEYYILVSIDGAQVFPSELSQQLRGDQKIRPYAVDIPFQRGSRLKVEMVSDATIGADNEKACWVDITVRYKPR